MRYERVRAAAILLGAGLGGFLDGIVLHQILHWHQMLSARVPPDSLEAMMRNTVADGWFHLAVWILTVAGIGLLWSGVRGAGRLPSARAVCGYALVGWGAFNLVEGIVNHHVLELHHVRDLPTHMVVYDWAFLILSGALILLGLALRDGKSRVPAPLAERRSGDERRMAYR
jgi:uncharacterized membrane protein